MRWDVVAAILAMALVTHATRVAGFLIGPWLPTTGRLRQALDAVPAAVLTAVAVPALAQGRAELAAGAIALLVARRLPMLATIALAMAVVAVVRAVSF